jgi:hypothetical protein
MKIKDFSPQSYTGLSNRKQLSKLSNEYRLAFFLYSLACFLSILTSSYGSFVGNLYLGIALVVLAEGLKLTASIGETVNKPALYLGIAVSVGTASFSSSLFFQLNNVDAVNKKDITERIERELDNFKAPSFSSNNLIEVQDNNIKLTKQLNSLQTASYRIKLYKRSRTHVMTGQKIVRLKRCGTSTTCSKVKAEYEAILKLLSQNYSKLKLIKTAIDSNNSNNVRKVELERELLGIITAKQAVIIPLWIQAIITASLIVVIEFLQILSRVKMIAVSPNLHSLQFHIKIWKFNKKSENVKKGLFNIFANFTSYTLFSKPFTISSKKSNLKPKNQKANTQKAVAVLTNNAPKQKRKKLNEAGIEQVIKTIKQRKVKPTKANILNELAHFNFGKTDMNYKLVRSKIAP